MVTIGDFEFKEDRYYSEDHIWVKVESTGESTMGLDPMGLAIAGNISMVRVKKAGKSLTKGRAFGTMESGKGVISLKSPLNGEILEVNPLVEDRKFEEMMDDPYENWLVKIKLTDESELNDMKKDIADIIKWAKLELSKLK
ncbi:MAG: glycine cleavage system protein H [Candidatus Hodarchaeota archaeon]